MLRASASFPHVVRLVKTTWLEQPPVLALHIGVRQNANHNATSQSQLQGAEAGQLDLGNQSLTCQGRRNIINLGPVIRHQPGALDV